MYTNERIYADIRAWNCFEGEDEHETIGVYRRCPECARYVSKGKVMMNLNGDIKLEDWKCHKHGEIVPFCDRDFGADWDL